MHFPPCRFLFIIPFFEQFPKQFLFLLDKFFVLLYYLIRTTKAKKGDYDVLVI
ncbi:hypothetical protein SK141_1328 [Streptococcus oralis]|nr:hypothetical protein SK141_1328 [Streptococcus oralis]